MKRFKKILSLLQNAVNVDTLNDDMLPSQSQVDSSILLHFLVLVSNNFLSLAVYLNVRLSLTACQLPRTTSWESEASWRPAIWEPRLHWVPKTWPCQRCTSATPPSAFRSEQNRRRPCVTVLKQFWRIKRSVDNLVSQFWGILQNRARPCVTVLNCRYLCEISGTSPQNLLMEEAALLAMVRSQEEITALIRLDNNIPCSWSDLQQYSLQLIRLDNNILFIWSDWTIIFLAYD